MHSFKGLSLYASTPVGFGLYEFSVNYIDNLLHVWACDKCYFSDATGKQKGDTTIGYSFFCTQYSMEGVIWEGKEEFSFFLFFSFSFQGELLEWGCGGIGT